jgi:hypothetical protein
VYCAIASLGEKFALFSKRRMTSGRGGMENHASRWPLAFSNAKTARALLLVTRAAVSAGVLSAILARAPEPAFRAADPLAPGLIFSRCCEQLVRSLLPSSKQETGEDALSVACRTIENVGQLRNEIDSEIVLCKSRVQTKQVDYEVAGCFYCLLQLLASEILFGVVVGSRSPSNLLRSVTPVCLGAFIGRKMAFFKDNKKALIIGGAVLAVAAVAGYALLSGAEGSHQAGDIADKDSAATEQPVVSRKRGNAPPAASGAGDSGSSASERSAGPSESKPKEKKGSKKSESKLSKADMIAMLGEMADRLEQFKVGRDAVCRS